MPERRGKGSMNMRRNMIAGAGLVTVALLILFPPWYVVIGEGRVHARISRGYHFLFSPPCCSPHIDLARYLVPVGVVCLMTLLACLEIKETRRESGLSDSRNDDCRAG
jgi:hypothetical protein